MTSLHHVLLGGLAASVTLLSPSFGGSEVGIRERCAFFPENKVRIPVSSGMRAAGLALSEREFRDALAEIDRAYTPVFAARGLRFTIQSDWSDDRVNVYATRDDDDNPILVAPGGLARHALMTRDALRTLFCHEIGHFLGGAPKARRGQTDKLSWSSAEGQADYFATSKCLRGLFNDEAENQAFVESLSTIKRKELEEVCTTTMCMRIVRAGEIAASVFAAVKGAGLTTPSLKSRDGTVVGTTVFGHPSPQCRLDTFVAGAKCAADPGVAFDDRDPAVGACDPLQQGGDGARPRCWFSQR